MLIGKIIGTAVAYVLLTSGYAFAQLPGSDFPDGPGKDTVVTVCNGCHDINRVRAGYNPAGWNMIQHMMQNMSAR
jgi:virginiamycin B lyase